MNYTPKHFRVEELVPKSIFSALGNRSLILLDARILFTLDMIRDIFGKPITVNNWLSGGPFDQRGFRTDPVGATYSQHRYGRAIDFDVKGIAAEEARQAIIKNKDTFKEITVLETDVSWVHMDCRNIERSNGNIVLVKL